MMALEATYVQFMETKLEPRSEPLRRAIGWISARRRERPDAPLGPLIAEASLRFDLGPADDLFLRQAFTADSTLSP